MIHPGKFILDPCCAGKMMWNNKNHPNVIYGDIRRAEKGHLKQQPNHSIVPDIILDFRRMPFGDKSLKLVVFDPPNLTTNHASEDSIMAKKFGCLIAETWQSDLEKGFNECWRVLEDFGVLIFKWNNARISYQEVLRVIKKEPLFQNILRKNPTLGHTYWACFMKIPKGAEQDD